MPTVGQHPRPVQEAVSIPVGQDADDWQYRALGKQGFDLPSLDQTDQIKISRFLYRTKLLAQRLLELQRDYVMGGDIGYHITAVDPEVQKVIDDHWNDPVNDWERFLPEYIMDLSMDGELLMPVTVEEGRVIMNQADPLIITKVDGQPHRHSMPKTVYVKTKEGKPDTPLNVISLDRDKGSPTFRMRTGDCFFWTINRVSSGVRGVSDLFILADFIDLLDRFLYARARNAELRNLFVWDVTMAGAGKTQIEEFLKDLMMHPPTSGSVRAHNESVAWNAVRPNLDSVDASMEAHLLAGYILFGFGVPPSVTGMQPSGRTSVAEQVDILYKTFASRGREVKDLISDVVNFVIDQAIIAGLIKKKDVDRSFSIITPRVTLRDVQRMGGALARVGDFFEKMQTLQIYEPEESRNMIDPFLSAIGFEVPTTHKKRPPAPPPAPTSSQLIGQPRRNGNGAGPAKTAKKEPASSV